jgi:hypothetical protein
VYGDNCEYAEKLTVTKMRRSKVQL